jgi:hypothetical protein
VRLFLGSLPMILFALDQEGIFTLSEGNGLSKLGLFPGQLVGQSVFAVYQDVPAILSDVHRALSGERFVMKRLNTYLKIYVSYLDIVNGF